MLTPVNGELVAELRGELPGILGIAGKDETADSAQKNALKIILVQGGWI